MNIANMTLKDKFWDNYQFTEEDFEYLYNFLLEIEKPQTTEELVSALVIYRITEEKERLRTNQMADSLIYQPKSTFKLGDKVALPSFDWKIGTVISIQEAKNPINGDFKKVGIDLPVIGIKYFASELEEHGLNAPIQFDDNDPQLNPDNVLKNYKKTLQQKLEALLSENDDLVSIASRWFPRSLLIDVNIGFLHLAEASLEMSAGGPLTTRKIMEQIEMPLTGNSNLSEFSLNLALQTDERFDEVGPAGEILWFLNRAEPEWVRTTPPFLRFDDKYNENDRISLEDNELSSLIIDELEPYEENNVDSINVSLLYPHWRSGTLPLTGPIKSIFPTAYESPRVQFSFMEKSTKSQFNGWVVRHGNYIYGLREYFLKEEIIPGGIITIEKGDKPGTIIISSEKRKTTRDWVRTVLVGADNGIVFAMLKQSVPRVFDERLVNFVPDSNVLDELWSSQKYARSPLEKTLPLFMRELAKLNHQGQVHAEELYSAINLVRRCPPGIVINTLNNADWAEYMGNLYYR